jgi:predicted RND superfamily exporter protein
MMGKFDLGIFASASIVLGLLFVLIFLPAMLATLKLKHNGTNDC